MTDTDKLQAIFDNTKEIKRRLDRVEIRLFGMGEDRGLLTRIDMLEDAQESGKWALRTTVAALLAVVGKFLHDIVR